MLDASGLPEANEFSLRRPFGSAFYVHSESSFEKLLDFGRSCLAKYLSGFNEYLRWADSGTEWIGWQGREPPGISICRRALAAHVAKMCDISKRLCIQNFLMGYLGDAEVFQLSGQCIVLAHV